MDLLQPTDQQQPTVAEVWKGTSLTTSPVIQAVKQDEWDKPLPASSKTVSKTRDITTYPSHPLSFLQRAICNPPLDRLVAELHAGHYPWR